jgi:hypothetical protein
MVKHHPSLLSTERLAPWALAGVVALVAVALVSGLSNSRDDLGVWVRSSAASPQHAATTLTVEACCDGGRRYRYHNSATGEERVVEASTRVDRRQLSAVEEFDGKVVRIWTWTISADGHTLTEIEDWTPTLGTRNPATHEPYMRSTTWVRKEGKQ